MATPEPTAGEAVPAAADAWGGEVDSARRVAAYAAEIGALHDEVVVLRGYRSEAIDLRKQNADKTDEIVQLQQRLREASVGRPGADTTPPAPAAEDCTLTSLHSTLAAAMRRGQRELAVAAIGEAAGAVGSAAPIAVDSPASCPSCVQLRDELEEERSSAADLQVKHARLRCEIEDMTNALADKEQAVVALRARNRELEMTVAAAAAVADDMGVGNSDAFDIPSTVTGCKAPSLCQYRWLLAAKGREAEGLVAAAEGAADEATRLERHSVTPLLYDLSALREDRDRLFEKTRVLAAELDERTYELEETSELLAAAEREVEALRGLQDDPNMQQHNDDDDSIDGRGYDPRATSPTAPTAWAHAAVNTTYEPPAAVEEEGSAELREELAAALHDVKHLRELLTIAEDAAAADRAARADAERVAQTLRQVQEVRNGVHTRAEQRLSQQVVDLRGCVAAAEEETQCARDMTDIVLDERAAADVQRVEMTVEASLAGEALAHCRDGCQQLAGHLADLAVAVRGAPSGGQQQATPIRSAEREIAVAAALSRCAGVLHGMEQHVAAAGVGAASEPTTTTATADGQQQQQQQRTPTARTAPRLPRSSRCRYSGLALSPPDTTREGRGGSVGGTGGPSRVLSTLLVNGVPRGVDEAACAGTARCLWDHDAEDENEKDADENAANTPIPGTLAEQAHKTLSAVRRAQTEAAGAVTMQTEKAAIAAGALVAGEQRIRELETTVAAYQERFGVLDDAENRAAAPWADAPAAKQIAALEHALAEYQRRCGELEAQQQQHGLPTPHTGPRRGLGSPADPIDPPPSDVHRALRTYRRRCHVLEGELTKEVKRTLQLEEALGHGGGRGRSPARPQAASPPPKIALCAAATHCECGAAAQALAGRVEALGAVNEALRKATGDAVAVSPEPRSATVDAAEVIEQLRGEIESKNAAAAALQRDNARLRWVVEQEWRRCARGAAVGFPLPEGAPPLPLPPPPSPDAAPPPATGAAMGTNDHSPSLPRSCFTVSLSPLDGGALPRGACLARASAGACVSVSPESILDCIPDGYGMTTRHVDAAAVMLHAAALRSLTHTWALWAQWCLRRRLARAEAERARLARELEDAAGLRQEVQQAQDEAIAARQELLAHLQSRENSKAAPPVPEGPRCADDDAAAAATDAREEEVMHLRAQVTSLRAELARVAQETPTAPPAASPIPRVSSTHTPRAVLPSAADCPQRRPTTPSPQHPVGRAVFTCRSSRRAEIDAEVCVGDDQEPALALGSTAERSECGHDTDLEIDAATETVRLSPPTATATTATLTVRSGSSTSCGPSGGGPPGSRSTSGSAGGSAHAEVVSYPTTEVSPMHGALGGGSGGGGFGDHLARALWKTQDMPGSSSPARAPCRTAVAGAVKLLDTAGENAGTADPWGVLSAIDDVDVKALRVENARLRDEVAMLSEQVAQRELAGSDATESPHPALETTELLALRSESRQLVEVLGKAEAQVAITRESLCNATDTAASPAASPAARAVLAENARLKRELADLRTRQTGLLGALSTAQDEAMMARRELLAVAAERRQQPVPAHAMEVADRDAAAHTPSHTQPPDSVGRPRVLAEDFSQMRDDTGLLSATPERPGAVRVLAALDTDALAETKRHIAVLEDELSVAQHTIAQLQLGDVGARPGGYADAARTPRTPTLAPKSPARTPNTKSAKRLHHYSGASVIASARYLANCKSTQVSIETWTGQQKLQGTPLRVSEGAPPQTAPHSSGSVQAQTQTHAQTHAWEAHYAALQADAQAMQTRFDTQLEEALEANLMLQSDLQRVLQEKEALFAHVNALCQEKEELDERCTAQTAELARRGIEFEAAHQRVLELEAAQQQQQQHQQQQQAAIPPPGRPRHATPTRAAAHFTTPRSRGGRVTPPASGATATATATDRPYRHSQRASALAKTVEALRRHNENLELSLQTEGRWREAVHGPAGTPGEVLEGWTGTPQPPPGYTAHPVPWAQDDPQGDPNEAFEDELHAAGLHPAELERDQAVGALQVLAVVSQEQHARMLVEVQQMRALAAAQEALGAMRLAHAAQRGAEQRVEVEHYREWAQRLHEANRMLCEKLSEAVQRLEADEAAAAENPPLPAHEAAALYRQIKALQEEMHAQAEANAREVDDVRAAAAAAEGALALLQREKAIFSQGNEELMGEVTELHAALAAAQTTVEDREAELTKAGDLLEQLERQAQADQAALATEAAAHKKMQKFCAALQGDNAQLLHILEEHSSMASTSLQQQRHNLAHIFGTLSLERERADARAEVIHHEATARTAMFHAHACGIVAHARRVADAGDLDARCDAGAAFLHADEANARLGLQEALHAALLAAQQAAASTQASRATRATRDAEWSTARLRLQLEEAAAREGILYALHGPVVRGLEAAGAAAARGIGDLHDVDHAWSATRICLSEDEAAARLELVISFAALKVVLAGHGAAMAAAATHAVEHEQWSAHHALCEEEADARQAGLRALLAAVNDEMAAERVAMAQGAVAWSAFEGEWSLTRMEVYEDEGMAWQGVLEAYFTHAAQQSLDRFGSAAEALHEQLRVENEYLAGVAAIHAAAVEELKDAAAAVVAACATARCDDRENAALVHDEAEARGALFEDALCATTAALAPAVAETLHRWRAAEARVDLMRTSMEPMQLDLDLHRASLAAAQRHHMVSMSLWSAERDARQAVEAEMASGFVDIITGACNGRAALAHATNVAAEIDALTTWEAHGRVGIEASWSSETMTLMSMSAVLAAYTADAQQLRASRDALRCDLDVLRASSTAAGLCHDASVALFAVEQDARRVLEADVLSTIFGVTVDANSARAALIQEELIASTESEQRVWMAAARGREQREFDAMEGRARAELVAAEAGEVASALSMLLAALHASGERLLQATTAGECLRARGDLTAAEAASRLRIEWEAATCIVDAVADGHTAVTTCAAADALLHAAAAGAAMIVGEEASVRGATLAAMFHRCAGGHARTHTMATHAQGQLAAASAAAHTLAHAALAAEEARARAVIDAEGLGANTAGFMDLTAAWAADHAVAAAQARRRGALRARANEEQAARHAVEVLEGDARCAMFLHEATEGARAAACLRGEVDRLGVCAAERCVRHALEVEQLTLWCDVSAACEGVLRKHIAAASARHSEFVQAALSAVRGEVDEQAAALATEGARRDAAETRVVVLEHEVHSLQEACDERDRAVYELQSQLSASVAPSDAGSRCVAGTPRLDPRRGGSFDACALQAALALRIDSDPHPSRDAEGEGNGGADSATADARSEHPTQTPPDTPPGTSRAPLLEQLASSQRLLRARECELTALQERLAVAEASKTAQHELEEEAQRLREARDDLTMRLGVAEEEALGARTLLAAQKSGRAESGVHLTELARTLATAESQLRESEKVGAAQELRVRALSAKEALLDEEVSSLREQLGQAESRIAEASERAAAAAARADDVTGQLAAAHAERTNLQLSLSEVSADHTVLAEERGVLRAANDALNARVVALDADAAAARGELRALAARYDVVCRQREELTEQVREVEERLASEERRAAAAEAQAAVVAQHAAGMDHRQTAQLDDIAELQNALASARADLACARRDTTRAQDDLAGAARERDASQAGLAQAEAQLCDAAADAAALRRELEQLRGLHVAAVEEVGEASTALEALRAEVAALTQAREASAAKIETAGEVERGLKTELLAMRLQLKEAAAHGTAADERHAAATARGDRAHLQQAEAAARGGLAVAESVAFAQVVLRDRAWQAARAAAGSAITAQLEATRAALTEATGGLKDLRAENRRVNKTIDATQEEVESLTRTVRAAEADRDRHKADCDHHRIHAAKQTRLREAAAEEAAVLRGRLAAALRRTPSPVVVEATAARDAHADDVRRLEEAVAERTAAAEAVLAKYETVCLDAERQKAAAAAAEERCTALRARCATLKQRAEDAAWQRGVDMIVLEEQLHAAVIAFDEAAKRRDMEACARRCVLLRCQQHTLRLHDASHALAEFHSDVAATRLSVASAEADGRCDLFARAVTLAACMSSTAMVTFDVQHRHATSEICAAESAARLQIMHDAARSGRHALDGVAAASADAAFARGRARRDADVLQQEAVDAARALAGDEADTRVAMVCEGFRALRTSHEHARVVGGHTTLLEEAGVTLCVPRGVTRDVGEGTGPDFPAKAALATQEATLWTAAAPCPRSLPVPPTAPEDPASTAEARDATTAAVECWSAALAARCALYEEALLEMQAGVMAMAVARSGTPASAEATPVRVCASQQHGAATPLAHPIAPGGLFTSPSELGERTPARLAALGSQMASATDHIRAVEEDNAREVERMMREVDGLVTRLETVRDERDALRHAVRIAHLERDAVAHRLRIALGTAFDVAADAAAAIQDTAAQRVGAAERAAAEARDTLRTRAAEVAELNGELEGVRGRLAVCTEEREHAGQRIVGFEARTRGYEHQLAVADVVQSCDAARVEIEADAWTAWCDLLTAATTAVAARVASVHDELTRWVHEAESSDAALAAAVTQLQSMSRLRDEAVAERERAQDASVEEAAAHTQQTESIVREHAATVATMRADLSNATARADALEAQVHALSAAHDALEDAAATHDEQLRAAVEQGRSACAALEADLEAAASQLASLASERDRLGDALAESKSTQVQQQTALAEMSELAAAKAVVEDHLADATANAKVLEAQVRTLSTELQDAEIARDAARNALEDAAATHDEQLRAAVEQGRSACAALEADLEAAASQLASERDRLGDALTNAAASVRALEAQVRTLSTELQDAENARDAARTALEDAAAVHDKRLQAAVEQGRSACATLEAGLATATSRAESLASERSCLDDALAEGKRAQLEQQTALAEKTAAAAVAQHALRKAEARVSECEAVMAVVAGERDRLASELDGSDYVCRQLRGEIDAARAAMRVAMAEVPPMSRDDHHHHLLAPAASPGSPMAAAPLAELFTEVVAWQQRALEACPPPRAVAEMGVEAVPAAGPAPGTSVALQTDSEYPASPSSHPVDDSLPSLPTHASSLLEIEGPQTQLDDAVAPAGASRAQLDTLQQMYDQTVVELNTARAALAEVHTTHVGEEKGVQAGVEDTLAERDTLCARELGADVRTSAVDAACGPDRPGHGLSVVEVDAMITERDSLRAQLDSCTADLAGMDALREDVARRTEDFEALRGVLEATREELDAAQKAALTTACSPPPTGTRLSVTSAGTPEVVVLRREVDAIVIERDSLREQLDECTAELTQVKTTVRECIAEVAMLAKDRRRLQEGLAATAAEGRAAEDALQQARVDADAAALRIDSLERELGVAEAERDALLPPRTVDVAVATEVAVADACGVDAAPMLDEGLTRTRCRPEAQQEPMVPRGEAPRDQESAEVAEACATAAPAYAMLQRQCTQLTAALRAAERAREAAVDEAARVVGLLAVSQADLLAAASQIAASKVHGNDALPGLQTVVSAESCARAGVEREASEALVAAVAGAQMTPPAAVPAACMRCCIHAEEGVARRILHDIMSAEAVLRVDILHTALRESSRIAVAAAAAAAHDGAAHAATELTACELAEATARMAILYTAAAAHIDVVRVGHAHGAPASAPQASVRSVDAGVQAEEDDAAAAHCLATRTSELMRDEVSGRMQLCDHEHSTRFGFTTALVGDVHAFYAADAAVAEAAAAAAAAGWRASDVLRELELCESHRRGRLDAEESEARAELCMAAHGALRDGACAAGEVQAARRVMLSKTSVTSVASCTATPSKQGWRIELDEEIVRAREALDVEFSLKIEEMRAALDDARTVAAERCRLLQQAERDAREARDVNHALQRTVSDLRADLHHATLRAQALQQHAEEADVARRAAETCAGELHAQLQAARADGPEPTADGRGGGPTDRQAAAATARSHALETKVHELQRAVDAARRQAVCHRTRVAALEADVAAERERVEALREADAAAAARLDAATEQRLAEEAAVAEKLDALQRRETAAVAAAEILKGERTAILARAEEGEREIVDLRGEVAQLQRREARCRGRIAVLEGELAEAHRDAIDPSEHARIKAALDAAQRDLMQKSAHAAKLQEEAARLKRDAAARRGEIKQLQAALAKAHEDVVRLKLQPQPQARTPEGEEELRALRHDIARCRVEVQRAEERVRTAQEEVRVVREERGERIAALEAAVASKDEDIAALKAQVDAQEEEVAAARERVAMLTDEAAVLRREGEERLSVVAATLQTVDKTRNAEIQRLTETVRRLTPPGSPAHVRVHAPPGVLTPQRREGTLPPTAAGFASAVRFASVPAGAASPQTPHLELDALKMGEMFAQDFSKLGSGGDAAGQANTTTANSILVISEEELDAWRLPGVAGGDGVGAAVRRHHDPATGLSYYSIPELELDASKLLGFMSLPQRDDSGTTATAGQVSPAEVVYVTTINATAQAVLTHLEDVVDDTAASALKALAVYQPDLSQTVEGFRAAMARVRECICERRAAAGASNRTASPPMSHAQPSDDAGEAAAARVGGVLADTLASVLPDPLRASLPSVRDVAALAAAMDDVKAVVAAPAVETVAEAVHATTINAMADAVHAGLARALDEGTARELRGYAAFAPSAPVDLEGFQALMQRVGEAFVKSEHPHGTHEKGSTAEGAIELTPVGERGTLCGEDERDALMADLSAAQDRALALGEQIRHLEAERRQSVDAERAAANTVQGLTRENRELKKQAEELRVKLVDAVARSDTGAVAVGAASRTKHLETTASELLAQNREMAIALDHSRTEERRLRLRNTSLVSKNAALESSCQSLMQAQQPGTPILRIEVPQP